MGLTVAEARRGGGGLRRRRGVSGSVAVTPGDGAVAPLSWLGDHPGRVATFSPALLRCPLLAVVEARRGGRDLRRRRGGSGGVAVAPGVGAVAPPAPGRVAKAPHTLSSQRLFS